MSPRPTLDPSDGAVYQSGLYSNDNQETLTLSGLGGELEANQSYQLYLFGASVFFSSQSNGQTLTGFLQLRHSAQSGSTDLVGHGYGEYTLTTGAAIPDTLDLSVASSGDNPSSYGVDRRGIELAWVALGNDCALIAEVEIGTVGGVVRLDFAAIDIRRPSIPMSPSAIPPSPLAPMSTAKTTIILGWCRRSSSWLFARL